MENPELTIVVPVYNVEKYLPQCLNSILRQEYRNFELLCVNDGSTDNSASILSDYAAKDPRIKIITKANGGLSSARNAGIEKAQGTLIGFVDSDDYIHPNMFYLLVNSIKTWKSDLSVCGVHICPENKNTDKNRVENFKKFFSLPTAGHYATCTFAYNSLNCCAWNKVYKTDIIKKNNLSFPEGLLYEDSCFFRSYLIKCSTFSIVQNTLYHYRIREGSITSSQGENSKKIWDHFWCVDATLARLLASESHLISQWIPELAAFACVEFLNTYSLIKENEKHQFLKLASELIIKIKNAYPSPLPLCDSIFDCILTNKILDIPISDLWSQAPLPDPTVSQYTTLALEHRPKITHPFLHWLKRLRVMNTLHYPPKKID